MDNNTDSGSNDLPNPLTGQTQVSSQEANPIQQTEALPVGGMVEPNVVQVGKTGFFGRLKLKIVIPILVFFLLTVSTSGAYFFIFVPRAQAQEFVDIVSEDYYGIKSAIRKISENYGDVSNSFEISKGAFFEITTMRTFQESKVDTAQDIVDIRETLEKVVAAKERKAKLEVPGGVAELNSKLDAYYSELDMAMNSLLRYEQFQMDMINAVGDEYNDKTKKLFDVYTTDTPRQVIIAYFNDLATLGDSAIARLEKLGQPMPDQAGFYDYILVSEKDRVDTIRKVVAELSVGDVAHDETASGILLNFSFRQEERNSDNQKNAQKVVEDSTLRKSFDSVLGAETSLVTLLDQLKEKYGIKNEEASPSPEKETSPSAKESTSGAK